MTPIDNTEKEDGKWPAKNEPATRLASISSIRREPKKLQSTATMCEWMDPDDSEDVSEPVEAATEFGQSAGSGMYTGFKIEHTNGGYSSTQDTKATHYDTFAMTKDSPLTRGSVVDSIEWDDLSEIYKTENAMSQRKGTQSRFVGGDMMDIDSPRYLLMSPGPVVQYSRPKSRLERGHLNTTSPSSSVPFPEKDDDPLHHLPFDDEKQNLYLANMANVLALNSAADSPADLTTDTTPVKGFYEEFCNATNTNDESFTRSIFKATHVFEGDGDQDSSAFAWCTMFFYYWHTFFWHSLPDKFSFRWIDSISYATRAINIGVYENAVLFSLVRVQFSANST